MRFSPFLTVACVASATFLAPAPLRAEISPIKMRVETKNDFDKGDKGEYSQSRQLNIILNSSAKEPLDLKVKYQIFARNLANKDVVSAGEGEIPVTVKPRVDEKVETPTVSSTSNDGRSSGGGGGRGGMNRNVKKPEPTGAKIMGYGVQVLQGDKVVAEQYEPTNLKEQFGKVPAAPKGK